MERDTLTETGRQMARLPVDPRIARMIIESGRQGCAREILVIAAALSIQDPRERPTDNQQAADTAHRRFAQPESDFVAFVALWDYLAEKQRELTGSAFRRLCRSEFLNYLRVREWQDLHGQLSSLTRELGINSKSSSSERSVVHTALLVRPALPRGHEGGAPRHPLRRTRRRRRPDAGRTRPPPAAGVPRRPRHQVRRLPRLRPREEAAGLDRRGRAGRDLAAVGQDRRRDRTGMGRADRRAPGQAELQRAPLVALARRRRRDREGHPLRHPDHRRPPAAAGADRPGAGSGAVHQARPGRGRLADQAPLLPRQHRPHRAGGRARAARPPPRPRGGRGRPVRVLRRPRPGRRRLRPRTSTPGGRRPATRRPDLLTLTLDDLLSDAAADLDTDAYPEMWTSSSPGLAGRFRLRAGRPLASPSPTRSSRATTPTASPSTSRSRRSTRPARRSSPGRSPACGSSWSPS